MIVHVDRRHISVYLLRNPRRVVMISVRLGKWRRPHACVTRYTRSITCGPLFIDLMDLDRKETTA